MTATNKAIRLLLAGTTMGAMAGIVFPGASAAQLGAAYATFAFVHYVLLAPIERAEVMAAHYPAQLYGWFMDEGRFGEYAISGEWLIDNGITEECE